ncbi:MAG: hypothetical protein ACJ71P_08170 [Nitrososphaeraceae archaeon]
MMFIIEVPGTAEKLYAETNFRSIGTFEYALKRVLGSPKLISINIVYSDYDG